MSNYGLTITGKIRVFRKDKVVEGKNKKKYDITDVWYNVSEKNDDGTFFNQSTNLIFKRGADIPDNNTTIELVAFPMITGSGNFRKIVNYVQEWEYEKKEVKQGVDFKSKISVTRKDKDPFVNDGQPIDISDDDLPF